MKYGAREANRTRHFASNDINTLRAKCISAGMIFALDLSVLAGCKCAGGNNYFSASYGEKLIYFLLIPYVPDEKSAPHGSSLHITIQ